MFVMQVTKHPAEVCPAYSKKFLPMTLNWYEKVEAVAKKHGVKFHGSWDDHTAHVVYVLYEAESMDQIMAMMMEPEQMIMLSFCSGRVFPVFDHKQTFEMLKHGHQE